MNSAVRYFKAIKQCTTHDNAAIVPQEDITLLCVYYKFILDATSNAVPYTFTTFQSINN